MKKITLCLLLITSLVKGQGYNHTWLLGTDTGFPMGKIEFDTNSYVLTQQQRKMTFKGTEATISDAYGNLLISSNGVWIANANNDTVKNGSGLNPGPEVIAYPHALLDIYSNIFLPFPGDSNKYVLFHHAMDSDANSFSGFEVFKSIIDITLDSVILKNDSVLSDTINEGFAACKHANGRDWWIVCQKQRSDIIITMLLTPSGVTNISYQSLGVPIARFNVTQLTFSQNGTKLAYNRYDPTTVDESLILADFDRCTGIFSNAQNVPITINTALWGLAFSASGNYVYVCSSNNIFQVDVVSLSVDTVATYDGFCFPFSPWCTTFWNMYLAANGKIYITSGNAVQHIHEMNFPDNASLSCDVQQHAINLNVIWYLRAVPNHPNYYLGCDTTGGCTCLTGIDNLTQHDFRFRIYPNPVLNNTLNIGYLLPQNKKGLFQIYDITGKIVFKYTLPQWSNEQSFKLPDLSDGVYNCVVTSNNYRASKKIAVINGIRKRSLLKKI